MLKTEKCRIGAHTYETTQLMVTEGKAVLLRLLKMAGPAFGSAVASAPELRDREIGSIQLNELGPVLSSVLERLAVDLNEDDLDFVLSKFAESTFVLHDGKAEKTHLSRVWETHFAGDYFGLAQWFAWIFRVNYLGFLSGQGTVAQALAKMQTKA